MGGNMTKVLPHLYIGGNENARDEGELIANCITHILTVQSTEAEINKLSKYEYLKVYVGKPASKCLLRVIPQTNDFIHAARIQSGNVLVHSESGMSANVAVVAAYLMTVYNLSSKVAVSTLQGLVPPAHPVTSLQNQLDRFDPETPTNIRGDAPISAASERERLLVKFGPWPHMERDQRFLKAALEAHDELKASGAFLISSGESRPRQRTPSPPPNTTAKLVLPKDKHSPSPPDPAYLNPDGEFRFDDAHGTSGKSDEDGFERIPTSPDDSEKSLADEDAIVGSIPVPRPGVTSMSLAKQSVVGGVSQTQVPNARAEKMATTSVADESEMMFEMTDEIRIRLDAAAAASDGHVPSTAPVYHDFTQQGLFSVTPEVIAVHQARRLANMLGGPPSSHTVLDLFTGIGGNCIQLAVVGFNVVTVDISESMLQMAKANARIYGVHKRITFVHADVFDFLRDTRQRFSATLASPPWGGPTYSSSTVFSLSSLTFSGESGNSNNFFNLLEAVASVTVSGGPVALFLPRSTNAGQLFELHRRFMNAALVDVIPQLECELALIHSKPKGLTVYLYYAGGVAEEGSEATFESLSESTSDSSTFYDCD